jgi:hypothetical protein
MLSLWSKALGANLYKGVFKMEKVSIDSTTRLYDSVVMETFDKWVKHQIEQINAGKPRNAEKYKIGADEFLQRAELLQDMETAVRKGKTIELPQWFKDKYAPAKPKTTQNKLVGLAPTSGQLHTVIDRAVKKEVAAIKDTILDEIRKLKVVK